MHTAVYREVGRLTRPSHLCFMMTEREQESPLKSGLSERNTEKGKPTSCRKFGRGDRRRIMPQIRWARDPATVVARFDAVRFRVLRRPSAARLFLTRTGPLSNPTWLVSGWWWDLKMMAAPTA